MPDKTTRRTFMKRLAATGAVLPFAFDPRHLVAPPRRTLRHACVGVGGMGNTDLKRLVSHPEVEIIALCDVDAEKLAAAAGDPRVAERFPGARTYRDWREMLAREGGRIGSVNVATPDHMHAPIAMTALRMGKHVYCQKPLAHDVSECRRLAEEAARRPRQVTSFGIQIHAHTVYRMAVKMIRTGLVGKIREVHSWCGKGWTGPPKVRPDRADPVPDTLDWDLWLGVAPVRPYVEKIYHPGHWRRWIDFGTGTLGDMACHIMDPVFSALDLTAPVKVRSAGHHPFEETYSPKNEIAYTFPGTPYTASRLLTYTWYDSGRQPDPTRFPLAKGQKLPGAGSMFVGEKGCLLVPHWAAPRPLPWDRFKTAVRAFKKEHAFPKIDHYHQFVDACLGKGKTATPFAYAGRLTEAVLLGLIAHRFPEEELAWDAERFCFPDRPEADRFLRRAYRKGWEVEGLG